AGGEECVKGTAPAATAASAWPLPIPWTGGRTSPARTLSQPDRTQRRISINKAPPRCNAKSLLMQAF
ncbi:hypothetical protein CR199_15230, partial [Enterococcus faecium]